MIHTVKLHAHVIKTSSSQSLRQLLLSFYGLPSENLPYARAAFNQIVKPDTFSWNTIIRAHSNSAPAHSLSLFIKMIRSGERPDNYTFPLVLKAGARVKSGWEVHGFVVKVGLLDCDVYVNNALISLYGSLGLMEDAVKVFEEMTARDLVSWSSMISCFANNGFGYDAVSLFQQMQIDGDVKPDEVMMLSVISGVAILGDLELGNWVHKYLLRLGLSIGVELGTALINMYSRCGDVDESLKLFNEIPDKNLLTWMGLINGLAVHGRGREAVEVFHNMIESGVRPDDIAFTGVLVACSHGGLVDEGWRIFNSIRKDYNIKPLMEHYGCMVDLLGRAGLVNKAYEFVQNMPIDPSSVIWRTLLGACVNHNHVELAEIVKKRIHELEPFHDGDYVLLSNAYSTTGKWAEKAGLMHSMEQKRISKQLGRSWINMDHERHEFGSGDTIHPEADLIREFLVSKVMNALKDQGYIPSASNAMFDVELEEKEHSIVHHSEKLAVAFALLKSKDHETIRIMKNLRICRDCHSFMKHVSNTFHRKIVVRDRNRFHHFEQGSCTCGDYW